MVNPIAATADFITAHSDWAPFVFGLLAFGESTAVLGVVVPATPLLFLVGSLIGAGKLDAASVVVWGVAGAALGYWLSWSIGRRAGYRIFHLPFFRDHRRGAARARLFFRRRGGSALILGRFVLGPFQSMLPLAAGVAAMDARRFHLWGIASAIIWVVVCLTPGYLSARGIVAVGFDEGGQQILIAGLMFLSVGLIVLALGGIVLRPLIKKRRV